MSNRNKYPTIRLRSEFYEKVGEPYGSRVNTLIDRYFELLSLAAASNPSLTEGEEGLLYEVWTSEQRLSYETWVDQIEEELNAPLCLGESASLAIHWGVDQESFLQKLRMVTEVGFFSLREKHEYERRQEIAKNSELVENRG